MSNIEGTSTPTKQGSSLAKTNPKQIPIPSFSCTTQELLQFLEKLFNECVRLYPALMTNVRWSLIEKHIPAITSDIWAVSKTGPQYMKEDKGRSSKLWLFMASIAFTVSLTSTVPEYYTSKFIMACLRLQSTKGCPAKAKSKDPKTHLTAEDIHVRMERTLPYNLDKFYKISEGQEYVTITARNTYCPFNSLLELDVATNCYRVNETKFAQFMKANKSKQTPKKTAGQKRGKRTRQQREEEEMSARSDSVSQSDEEPDPASAVSVKSRRVTRSTSPQQGLVQGAAPAPQTQTPPPHDEVMRWLCEYFPLMAQAYPEHFHRVIAPMLVRCRGVAEDVVAQQEDTIVTAQADTNDVQNDTASSGSSAGQDRMTTEGALAAAPNDMNTSQNDTIVVQDDMTIVQGDQTASQGDAQSDTTADQGDTTAGQGDTTADQGDTTAAHDDTAVQVEATNDQGDTSTANETAMQVDLITAQGDSTAVQDDTSYSYHYHPRHPEPSSLLPWDMLDLVDELGDVTDGVMCAPDTHPGQGAYADELVPCSPLNVNNFPPCTAAPNPVFGICSSDIDAAYTALYGDVSQSIFGH